MLVHTRLYLQKINKALVVYFLASDECTIFEQLKWVRIKFNQPNF